MHGRGKDFEYRAVFPSGRTEVLLKVPRFHWHWQNWYNLEQPIALPKGTRIDCTAHFDNSPNNPEAADPTKEVTWGDQSWDEMPRWTPENRPSIDSSKPATTGVATETRQL
jgi:hypothetical protein